MKQKDNLNIKELSGSQKRRRR